MCRNCTKSSQLPELKQYIEQDAIGNLSKRGTLLCLGHKSNNTFWTHRYPQVFSQTQIF